MSEIDTIAARQGWSRETLLDLLLTFLSTEPDAHDRFVAFIKRVADEENEDGGVS